MCVQKCVSKHKRVIFLQCIRDGPEVSKRLAHLLAIDIDEPIVHPVLDQRGLSRTAFGLEDFSFVVRESQIVSTTVNIELLTKVLERHRTTLNVPTGSTISPW